MVLIESVKAVDLLFSMAMKHKGVFREMLDRITSEEKSEALDDWMSMQFPHGTDRLEYLEFFRDHANKIYSALGIARNQKG